MDTFIECEKCGFVLQAESDEEAKPKGRDDCPDCGGTEFESTR